jgi:hypothetical protein
VAASPGAPVDPDLFGSSNTLFGEPGIDPQGSPMTPARCRSNDQMEDGRARFGVVPMRSGI